MPVRQLIQQFEPYAWEPSTQALATMHGLDAKEVIRFDLNTSPYNPYTWIRQVIRTLPQIGVNQYPDTSYTALRRALAEYTGFHPDQFVVTNGADEALDIIGKTYIDSGTECIISQPTYAYFRIVTELLNGRVIAIPRTQDFEDDGERILQNVSSRTRLIFLCSPNNPTGNTVDRSLVQRLLQETEATVVVDEAYYEFGGASFADLTDRHTNIVIVRTLSKGFGLAGARVGYTIAAKETVNELNKARPPNSLSVISLALAEIALRDTRTLRRMVRAIVRERERCYNQLRGLPKIRVYPSQANFLLIRFLAHDAADIHEALLRRGLVVRNLTSVPGLKNCLRFNVALPRQNDRFLKALMRLVRA